MADVVEFIARILEAAACEGETLNVGTQAPDISMQELGALILKTVGQEAAIETGEDTPGSPERRAPDMSRARGLTGYESRVDLATGLQRTYDWYRRVVFDAAGLSAV